MAFWIRLLAVVCALGCGRGVAAAITVVDDTGRRIELEKPATRIVSLSPHITELLFAAGAGGAVVGVSDYSDFPEQAGRLPRVSSGAGIDVERVLRLRPDLVIAWHSGNSAAQVRQLERLGLPVFRSEPRAIDTIATSLERFGRLAGSLPVAAAAAREFRAEVEALRVEYAGREPVDLFYQIGERPLLTVNGDHIISHWLRLCGARNLFAGQSMLVPVVDVEAVVAANPRVLVADWYLGRTSAWQERWRRFPFLKAVRGNDFLTVADETLDRQTPRAVQAARVLCEAIEQVRRKDQSAD
jgi:iron complex transport system substrate-binding protein